MDEKYVFFKIEIFNSKLPEGLFIAFRLQPSIIRKRLWARFGLYLVHLNL